jgi:hypothetical protein
MTDLVRVSEESLGGRQARSRLPASYVEAVACILQGHTKAVAIALGELEAHLIGILERHAVIDSADESISGSTSPV